MNLAIQSTTARTWKQVKAHYLLVGGAALAIAAATAWGGWQLSGGGGHGVASVTPRFVAAAPAATREPNLIYYLVSSQAQADLVSRGEEEGAAIRSQYRIDDEPQDQVGIFIVTDDASLDGALQAVYDTNAIRFQTGLPETKLVDLRAFVQ
jgi:hypothetical protein